MLKKWRVVSVSHQYTAFLQKVSGAYAALNGRIDFRYGESTLSIARVSKLSTGYQILIAAALPAQLDKLFAAIFHDEALIEWLAYDSPFRSHLQKLLTRTALDFVFYHELGHILGGHADVMGQNQLSLHELELVRRGKSSTIPKATRQVWEYEADIIAAGYIAKDAAKLIQSLQADDASHQLRTIFGAPQIAVEQVSSLIIIACYSLFRLLRETALQLDMESYHPDPLVRAFSVRDAIHSALSQQFSINDELLDILLSARFEEFDDALEASGYEAGFRLDDDGIEQVNQVMSSLVHDSKAYRAANTDLGYVSWPTLTSTRMA